jgi:(p)ppGpp synthase/HD superfamily hydrolase
MTVPDEALGGIQATCLKAVEWHLGQSRKRSNLPFVTHCFEVMKRVAWYWEVQQNKLELNGEEMLMAAIMHDVFEDCPDVTAQMMVDVVGEDVRTAVEEMTRPENAGKGFYRKYQWLESFFEKSRASVVIKIADRYCNVLDYFSDEQKRAYASKYALQAYPLYRTYLLGGGENNRVIGDIRELNSIAQRVYPVDMMSMDDRTLKLVREIAHRE